MTTARHYAIWALYYLGRVGAMSRRVRRLLRVAREDGDLYSARNMATANSNIARLASDDVAEARLARERGPYAAGYDTSLRAAVSWLEHDRAGATALLEAFGRALESADMLLHANAARWRWGQLAGGEDGEARRRQAQEYLLGEQSANPARMVGMLAPGFPDEDLP